DAFADLTNELDYEGELGVVIGKEAHNVQPHLALDYVYGYTIVNDITARDLQRSLKQFFLAKSLAAPIGPYIVTKDELPSLNDEIADLTNELDYEVELGVVIGKEAHNVQPHLALDYVYGYTIVNDITARDLQRSLKQFFLAKSLAAPIGPYIVTKDEVPSLND